MWILTWLTYLCLLTAPHPQEQGQGRQTEPESLTAFPGLRSAGEAGTQEKASMDFEYDLAVHRKRLFPDLAKPPFRGQEKGLCGENAVPHRQLQLH